MTELVRPVEAWTVVIRRAVEELRAAGATDDDVRGCLLGVLVGMCQAGGIGRAELIRGVDAAWLMGKSASR